MTAGSKLGRYELLARLAAGGMGEIFLARLEGAAGFEKLCVIKRILPHLADDARYRSMLIGEARIASSMSHANICHIYELDETDQQLYLVMEYLEGGTLQQLLALTSRSGEQLDYGLIAGIVQQASDGLHYAHELRDRNGNPLGVVHRDVTPSNLFLTESGVVKILDFGIAKVSDAASTEAGVIKGKYAYMAPEQVERTSAIDRRIDVFALAVVTYEMVTCRRLYQRASDYLTFRAVMEQVPIDLAKHRSAVPPGLTEVIARGLAHDLGERYATARQFGAAVLGALGVKPWGQTEISELVRTAFADDIQRHNAEISKLIRQLEQQALRTMPAIPRRRNDDGEVGFSSLAIESEVADDRTSLNDQREQSDGLGQGPAPTGPMRLPSHVLPILGVVGAAAVVLMIGLMVLDDPAAPRTAAAKLPPAAEANSHTLRTGPPRRLPNDPYGAAIASREHELDQCTRDHAEPLASAATAIIVIGVDGRAKLVQLRPESANLSALGNCIRGVLRTVTFPNAAKDKELALGLAVR